jgi:very-short-patch-repair endonuclease
MRVRRCQLEAQEIVKKRGLPATSLLRTLRDICLLLSLTESVVVADMALHKRLLTSADLARFSEVSAGRHGAKMLSRVVQHAEPKSESPMETRMRMVLVLARLPRPEAQVPVYDGHQFVGRLDLYYRKHRLGVEYDGAAHSGTLAEDNRRQNRFLEIGIRLLRFTAGDFYNNPGVVVRQVRAALKASV